MCSGSLVWLVLEGQTRLVLGLGKALAWSSWQPFLQPLQACGQSGSLRPGRWGAPERVRSWQDKVVGLVAVPPKEEAAGWMSVTLPRRGSWRERSGCSPPSSDGREQRWVDNTDALACTATLPRGLRPVFPASGPGGVKGDQCPSPRAASAPTSPHTWVLGEVRGQAPGPGGQRLLAVVTQNVCARACKCGCKCVCVCCSSL